MKTNEDLRKDVVEELNWDPQLREVCSSISVTADDGMITLSGLVNTYGQKLAAEKAAQRVAGVTVVAVELEVKIKGPHLQSDVEIARAVKNSLKWNVAVQEDEVEVKVDNGWIYLDGTAEWEYQRKAAEYSIRDLMGVRGVTNRILVKAKAPDVSEIRNKISAALHRSATVDSSSINTEINGNRIVLNGKVRSWAEKKDAEKAVWSAPGVMIVDNRIDVDTEILV